MRSPVSRGSTSGGPNDGGRGGESLRARERRRVEARDRRRGGGARDPRLGPRPRRRGDGRRGRHLLLPCGEEEARLHRDAAEAEQAAQARAQDLRGLRLLQDPGPGRGRAGQAPVAGRPLRAPQRRLRRARRHREDAPRAGLRARVLRECCMRGLKTYYIKATELRDRFQKAVQRGNTSRVVSSLVKPSCLIVDEVGRCVYDRPCTDLFFDVVDRRYEKEGPNAMVLTSNIAPSGWDEFFTGDDTLLCALDRLFDKASVFVMRGPSYRGRGLDTYSVEAVPQAVKVRGIQPEGM